MMTNSSIFLDDMDFPPAAYLFGADERRAQLVLREVERVVRDTQEVGSAWRGHLEAMNDAGKLSLAPLRKGDDFDERLTC